MSARTTLARGDVVLITFPFTDLTSQKLRPAVIVGRISGPDLIVAFITSQVSQFSPSAAEARLDSNDAEFARTGLRVASRVRLDKLATPDRGLVQRRLGYIGPRAEQAIAAGLRYVLEL